MMNDAYYSEWLLSIKEKYDLAKKYVEESKNDPPQDPYKSKYKAKEVLCGLDLELNSRCDALEKLQLRCLSVLFEYDLGVICYDTEDLHASEVFLNGCWEKIKDYSKKEECCLLAVNVLNHLGILWSGRDQPSKACEYLKKAEQLYNSYKTANEICPYDFSDLFLVYSEPKNEDWSNFESVFTYTLYYLAQVYEQLEQNELAAKYCHMTLKRQKDDQGYNPTDWAVNGAALSQYFIEKNDFGCARHLLACATYIISEQEKKLKEQYENKEEDIWEVFNRAKADIARCWLKYCLNLFSFSQDKIQENSLENVATNNWNSEDRLLETEAVLEIEKTVICGIVCNYEDARQLFLSAQAYVAEAKVYYALNQHTHDYVQITQEHSELYKYLVFFEKDLDRQCKMHKRRVDMLEDILEKLNPQYYLAVCRQLKFELGETCSEMMDLKLRATNLQPHKLSPLAVKKINSLVMRSVKHFESFLDTLRDVKKTLPKTFPEDLARPALVAYFYLGRLHSKILESDEAKQMYNLSKSEECYTFILDYVEKNPDHASLIEKELSVVKEMVSLLPKKMLALTGSTMF